MLSDVSLQTGETCGPARLRIRPPRLGPAQTVFAGFVAVGVIGTILLLLPVSRSVPEMRVLFLADPKLHQHESASG